MILHRLYVLLLIRLCVCVIDSHLVRLSRFLLNVERAGECPLLYSPPLPTPKWCTGCLLSSRADSRAHHWCSGVRVPLAYSSCDVEEYPGLGKIEHGKIKHKCSKMFESAPVNVGANGESLSSSPQASFVARKISWKVKEIFTLGRTRDRLDCLLTAQVANGRVVLFGHSS